jgi:hypothetical protein
LGEGVQVCSNEGDSPRVKIHWNFLKHLL